MLDIYCRSRSAAAIAHHFKINKSRVGTSVKKLKKIRAAITAVTPTGMRDLHFVRNTLSAHTENAASVWVQDCHEKGIPINANINDFTFLESYVKVKQNKGEGSKAGEFNASKGWFDNFRNSFDLKKKVQITGETASDDQQAANEFPNTVKKITEKKRYQPR